MKTTILVSAQRRRGSIRASELIGTGYGVEVYVPLAEMFGYVGTVRSLSQGRATFTMRFSHYAAVPKGIAAKVIEGAR